MRRKQNLYSKCSIFMCRTYIKQIKHVIGTRWKEILKFKSPILDLQNEVKYIKSMFALREIDFDLRSTYLSRTKMTDSINFISSCT